MIYILAAIGLYFVLNFVGYVMKQNQSATTNSNVGSSSTSPIEAQRIRQQHSPLLTEEQMSERIARIYSATKGCSFEEFQYKMRFVLDREENIFHQKCMKAVLEKEKRFLEKYGFNMNENQVRIAISNQALDLDENESPYW